MSEKIPVHTINGFVTVEGERVGTLWAVTKHLHSFEDRGRIWRVTHLPSGFAVIKPTTKKHARTIARALNRECSDGAWNTSLADGIDPTLKQRALEVIEREGGVNGSTRTVKEAR